MKTSFLLLIGILFSFLVQAQRPDGKWKLVSFTQATGDGEKTDLLKGFLKHYPCQATATIEFNAGGEITARADNCPPNMRQTPVGIKWKMPAKDKIMVFMDAEDTDPVTYNLEIIGNKMRWIINYGIEDPKDIKQLVAEFSKA